MKTATITRKSKIGFGWNTCPTGNGTEIEPTTSPDITGTPKTVLAKKLCDPVYRSLQSTYKNTGWFVKIDRAWEKIDLRNDCDFEHNLDMMINYKYDGHFFHDEITVAIY